MRVVPCHGPRALLWAALSVVVVALTTGNRAAAQDQRPLDEAIVIVPHDCVTLGRLVPELERLLGRDTLDHRVRVDIATVLDGLAIKVLYAGAERGVRHIKREAQCSDYVDVVAITVAMALEALVPPEPRASSDAGQDVTSDDAGPALAAVDDVAVAAAPPRNAPGPAPREDVSRRIAPSVRAAVEASSNLLPAQAWSFATAIDLRRDPLGVRWRFGSGVVFPSRVAIGGGDVTGSVLFGRAGGCLWPLSADLQWLRLCGGVLVGAVVARGTTPGLARTTILPLVHPSLGPELSIPVAHGVALVLGVDALVGVVRPELVVAAPGDRVLARRRPDLFGLLVGVGLEWSE